MEFGEGDLSGTVIEHWLNGERVLSFDSADPKWKWYVDLLAIRGGDLSGRGGRLSLQDHGQECGSAISAGDEFRNRRGSCRTRRSRRCP